MPILDDVQMSCGIRELHGLCRDSARYNPKDSIPPKTILLEAFQTDYYTRIDKLDDIKFGIVIFSDSVRRGNGKKLATFITKEKLGKVVASDVVNNPNTRRPIQMWMWYLDRPALIKWLKANRPDEEREELRVVYGYGWDRTY